MAIKFINKMTGTEMWVDESRAAEYAKLGYRQERKPEKEPVKTPETKVAPVQPKKRSTRKK